MSIRARVALFGGSVIAVTLLVFGALLYGLSKYSLERDQDQVLAARASSALASLAAAPRADFTPRPALAPIDLKQSAQTAETFVEVLDQHGAPITSNGELNGKPPVIPQTILATATAEQHVLRTFTPPGGLALRVYVAPWQRPDLGYSGYVVTGQPVGRIARQLNGLRALLWGTSIVVLVIACGVMWRVTSHTLRPLREMTKTANEIGRTQDLSRRLPVGKRRDDVAILTTSFNGMLDRLQDAQDRLATALDVQQRFVADASHELRTPLTSIRSNAGFLLAHPAAQPDDRVAALQDIAAEGERMARLVEDLLTLARADAGQRLVKTRLDVRPIVDEVARQAQRLHSTRELAVTMGEAPVVVDADPDAIRQLLWILIDNAVKHTQRGGRIELRLDGAKGSAAIAVADDGEGIPEADLPRIFDRFYRADRSRPAGGAGLGLAIARWIVQEHQGRIVVCNNSDGGATFTVWLPLADAVSSSS